MVKKAKQKETFEKNLEMPRQEEDFEEEDVLGAFEGLDSTKD